MAVYGYLLMASDMLLILGGATMFWFSPRLRRSWFLGYGSPRSMINDTTWQAANRFAGLVLAMLSLIAMTVHVSILAELENNDVAQTVAVGAVFSLPIAVMYLTEKYLARVFKT